MSHMTKEGWAQLPEELMIKFSSIAIEKMDGSLKIMLLDSDGVSVWEQRSPRELATRERFIVTGVRGEIPVKIYGEQ